MIFIGCFLQGSSDEMNSPTASRRFQQHPSKRCIAIRPLDPLGRPAGRPLTLSG